MKYVYKHRNWAHNWIITTDNQQMRGCASMDVDADPGAYIKIKANKHTSHFKLRSISLDFYCIYVA